MTLEQLHKNRQMVFEKHGHPKEFTVIDTDEETIIMEEWPDGFVQKSYERRRISKEEIEITMYPNRFPELLGGCAQIRKKIVKALEE